MEITSVTVYWDNQDRSNEGWAYRASSDHASVASGGIDADTLRDAVEQTIWELDLPIQADDFGFCRDEGGYAVWSK